MEIDGGGCNMTQTNQFPSVGKLQKVQEEHGGEAQQNAPTQQIDTMQHPPSSGTPSSVPDDYQSASHSAKNSTNSPDSGVGRSPSCNSSSQLLTSEDTDELESLTAQCVPVHESGDSTAHVLSTDTDASNLETLVMEMARKIGASLGKVVKELTDRVENLELQIRRLQSEVRSLKRSSVAESTSDLSSFTSPCPDSPETEPTLDVSTVESQSQFYTRTKERLNSDSKIMRHRQSEIKRKQVEFAKQRPHSEIIHTQTILEDLPAHEEENKKYQKADPRQQVTDKPRLTSREEELRCKVTCSLPEFIELTNWEYLVPQLVSEGLLDPAITDYLLNETRTEHKKGVHFYLKVLPSKGPDAYTRFYKCLCDEKKHSGHESLVQICDK